MVLVGILTDIKHHLLSENFHYSSPSQQNRLHALPRPFRMIMFKSIRESH
jgi:hypothetical protein